MSETKLGKITTTPKGEWSSTASYERLDIVQLKGTSWIAKRANTGVEPTEGDDWMLSAEGAPQIDDTTVSAETPWSSKNTVDRFCPEITGEGNPVVLENCVEGYPLGVTASWEVQQEGSGTPHIEGYGTNKFLAFSEDTTLTNNGLTLEYTAATETLHIYGTNTSTVAWIIARMGLNSTLKDIASVGKAITLSWDNKEENVYAYFTYENSAGSSAGLYLNASNPVRTYTIPDDFESFLYIQLGIKAAATTIDTTIKIQIEEGSTATEWTPYAANIRPFVGKESVKIQTTNGENTNEATLSLPETIYAGSVGTDGKVEKTHAVIPISECNKCNVKAAERDWLSIYVDTTRGYAESTQHLSNAFPYHVWDYFSEKTSLSNPYVWSARVSFGIAVPKSLLGVADDYTGTDDEVVSLIRTWLNTIEPTPVFEAELATPKSLTTTPATFPALSGANTITADADTMTVSAREDRPRFTGDDVSESLGYVPAAQTDLEATQATVGEMIVNSSTTPWKTVQNIVQSGIAPQVFPVGTQFKVETQSYGTLLFDVVGHNHHKNPNDLNAPTMTLQSHYVIPNRAIDAEELLWVNTTDSELPAGTYHFTAYKSDYNQDAREDGTFQFTITKAIPVNGGFRHTNIGLWRYSYGVDNILGNKIVTYDADNNVLDNNLAFTQGSEGTDLGTFSVSASDINVTMGTANCTQRSSAGSNNYKESGIRQWLNASTTDWWTKQTPFDRPTNYNSKLGFLGDVDSEFAAVLGETDIVVTRNKLYEYDGTLGGSYTLRDKMFLPSMTELDLGTNSGIKEGSTLEYYDGTTDTDRIKYNYPSTTASNFWWLRSIYSASVGYLNRVSASGVLAGYLACVDFGIAPCCVIY